MDFFELFYKRWVRLGVMFGLMLILLATQLLLFVVIRGDPIHLAALNMFIMMVGFIFGKMSGIDETMHRIVDTLGIDAALRVALAHTFGSEFEQQIEKIETVMRDDL